MGKLEDLRKEKGFTIESMAEKLGISEAAYFYYERSQRGVPKEVAIKISEVLGVKVEDIFVPIKFTVSKTK